MYEELKAIAEDIVKILETCRNDDITDSSGYFVIKDFGDDIDRAVDVYKSTNGGNPHYVIYKSYEDEDADWDCTNDLSVQQLYEKLKAFYDEPKIESV